MNHKPVEIYTWASCPFCIRAKALLDQKGIKYTEHQIDGDEAARAKMVSRTGGPRSVPQIFVDSTHHVGGCDALYALENSGKLESVFGLKP